MKKIMAFIWLFAAALVLAACGTAATGDRGEGSGTVLSIRSDMPSGSSVGEEYTFTLVAQGVPAGVRGVTFEWSFDGAPSEYRTAAVKNGAAMLVFKRSFAEEREYRLSALVGRPTSPTDMSQYEQLATAELAFTVGADGGPVLNVTPAFVVGGAIGQAYDFSFEAAGVPEDLSSVAFTWSVGSGATQRADVAVEAGAARSGTTLTFDRAGTYTLNVMLAEPYTAGDDFEEFVLASRSVSIVIADGAGQPAPDDTAVLTIDPNAIADGRVGQNYTFTLSASDVPADLTEVTFAWQFQGEPIRFERVAVVGGVASHTVNRTFDRAGAYWLHGYVSRPTDSTDLANHRVLDTAVATIAIDVETPVREVDLGSCDGWVETQAGGHGVTVDRWNLRQVPVGAVIDFRYYTYSIPDNFIIEYPVGDIAYETGWVGDAWHAWPFIGQPQLYPGGIVGGPSGTVEGVFTKLAGQEEFRVTVLGPDQDTLWNYEIRCHVPN